MGPENDTPEALSDYIGQRGLETSQWHFLTGEKEDVWNLAKNGFQMPVSDDSAEVNAFLLIDWEGRIRGYYDSADISDFNRLKQDTGTVYRERTPHPADVINPVWIESRMQAQLETTKQIDAFHDFKFSDEIESSGITFSHKIVDDIAAQYKAVHYDHGNAIAVADVDLDGLYDIYFTTMIGTNELWRNLGNGKFENTTEQSGLLVDDLSLIHI